MTNPAVSVIIPVYNSERYIAAALDSVIAQSLSDFELLVVDDGSPDQSVSICRRYSDPRIRIISQENRGLAGARNTGIRNARGCYIAFLDADDVWTPDKLARHVGHLESRPAVGVSYSHSAFIDGDGRPLGIYQTVGRSPTSTALIMKRNPIGNGSNAVIRAEVFDPNNPKCAGSKVGDFLFDEELRQAEDLELWARIATQTRWRFDCVPLPLTQYRVNLAGLSADTGAQRDYHFAALEKIRHYAPEMVERYRATNIAHMYWYLARILVLRRESRRALRHCLAALRAHLPALHGVSLLLMAAAVLQRVLPARTYSAIERVGFTVIGKCQEWSMARADSRSARRGGT